MSTEPTWAIMPILAAPDLTEAAIADLLAQSVPTRLLLINQGVDDAFRDRLERIAEQEDGRIFLWSHQPPLPSLSATWNRALDFVWAVGGEVALVVNNDVRLHPQTAELLQIALGQQDALFVSAVGVTKEQFDPTRRYDPTEWRMGPEHTKGGPDFSCYLIAKECHDRFRFDERFVPAFCEDLDYHRRLMLAGEGQRMFSVNLPYLHYASQTLKTLPEKEANRIRQQIESQSRRYYAEKWGGPVNHETFVIPFGERAIDIDGSLRLAVEGLRRFGFQPKDDPSTSALFDRVRARWNGPPLDELNRQMLGLGEKEIIDGQDPRPAQSER